MVILALITVYMLLMLAQAVINMGNSFAVIPAAGFIAVMYIFYGISKAVFKRHDFELEGLALLLSGTGVMLAATHNTDTRQAYVQLAAVVLGLIIYSFMIWFIEVPDRVMKWRLFIAIGSILLLGSTLVLGTALNGAKNWIVLGPVSVQPSEFAKIAYIFVGASTLDVLQTKKSLTEFIIVSAISVGLLVLMSDFGTAVIFFVTFLIISFMRSGDLKTVILAVTAAVLGVIIMLSVKPYIAERFAAWGHVWEYADGAGYQQVNSLIYSASGGLFGVGLSKGWLQYLFASENDLVFCMMIEEIGLIIALLTAAVIGGFMIYARGVTTRSRSTFYSIAACSAGGLLVFQSALNIFGVTDILPLEMDRDRLLRLAASLETAAYGYSVSVTPLHLLTFYNGIANKGRMMRPYLVEDVERNGRVLKKYGPGVLGNICSRATADTVTRALRGVVTHGTARSKLRAAELPVAGKTGTSRVVLSPEEKPIKGNAYQDASGRKKNQGTFIGFFPYNRPKYSVIVTVYSRLSHGSFYGGDAPAKAVREIVDNIFPRGHSADGRDGPGRQRPRARRRPVCRRKQRIPLPL